MGDQKSIHEQGDTKTTTDTSILFYGKRPTLKRAPVAMRPGEDHPLIVSMSSLIMPCPLGQFSGQSRQVEICGSLIQIPLDLAPSAVMCPHCFGLFFVDESHHATRHHDADGQMPLEGTSSLFGYATYPDHVVQCSARIAQQNTRIHL